MSASVEDRVQNIICEQMGTTADKITEKTSFINDLGADSLDTVELIMALEEEFSQPEVKFEIPDEEAEKITTLGQAIDYIEAHAPKEQS